MLLVVLTVLCGVALLVLWLVLPAESDIEQREPFWGLYCAHRGLHTPDKTVPENSIAAFTAAVDAGYGIELDIRLSKDGQVVVFHDDTLARVCGVDARVDSLTLEELQKLPLHGTNQRIPTLREVLDVVAERTPLIIELKHGPQNRTLCEQAWRILRLYDGDICIESFDPRVVRWFKKKVPGLLRGQLAAPPAALKQGAQGFVVGTLLCNALGRPHFVAYQKGHRPLLVRLACRFCMRVAWTIHPGDDTDLLEKENDALIFEFFRPETHFDAGGLVAVLPGEEAAEAVEGEPEAAEDTPKEDVAEDDLPGPEPEAAFDMPEEGEKKND